MVIAMDLIEVNIIGTQSAQTMLNLGHDGFAAQPFAIWA